MGELVGVPDATPIFQGRSDEGFEAFIFDATGAASKIAFEEGKGGASFIAHCFAMWCPSELTVYVDAKVFG